MAKSKQGVFDEPLLPKAQKNYDKYLKDKKNSEIEKLNKDFENIGGYKAPKSKGSK